MRLFVLAAMFAGCAALSACSFMEPSAGPAARWAAIEKERKAKAYAKENPQLASAQGEVICKTMTPTGTIMPKKVCSTEAEWEAFDAETAKSADKFNDLRRAGSMEPGKDGAQFKRN